jgi:hypothetical protein
MVIASNLERWVLALKNLGSRLHHGLFGAQ